MPYANGYNFRIPVVIFATRLPTTLTDYPFAFFGTYPVLRSRAAGGQVFSASAFDVIFTSDAAGSTLLKFERVFNDLTTGRVEYHIKVPSVSSTVDTTIYLFAGNASVLSDQSNKTAVWDSDYKGVWHFGDGVTLDLTDSTSNGNNGTNHSAIAVVQWMGGAAQFNKATSAYVDVGSGASLNLTGSLSIENAHNWFDFPVGSNGIYPTVYSKFQSSPISGYWMTISANDFVTPNNTLYMECAKAGTEKKLFDSGFAAYVPCHRYSTYDGASGNAKLYFQGAQYSGANFGASAIGAATGNANIGRIEALPTITLWNGWIDELRISDIVRSSDWIQATYLNQYHPTAFYTLGTPGQGSGSLYSAAKR
jgi:hypothetical protein